MKSVKSTLTEMPRVGDCIRLLAMDDIQAHLLGRKALLSVSMISVPSTYTGITEAVYDSSLELIDGR